MLTRGTLHIRDNLEEIDRAYSEENGRQILLDFAFIARCMKHGIRIDRKTSSHKDQLPFSKCFIASEAIDWMINHPLFTKCKTRKDAEQLGEQLCQNGIITATTHSGIIFQDNYSYYRFKEDEGAASKVLNEVILWSCPSHHRAPDVASKLLYKAIELYLYLEKDTVYFSTANQTITVTCQSFSPVINEFEEATAELQQIDTKEDLNHEECLSFWINIYHLLEVHRIIRTKLHKGNKPFGPDDSYQYNIAGAYYSMYDIENILRSNIKTQTVAVGKKSKSKRRETICAQFAALHRPNPEINFALNCGATVCPPITVYEPHTVYRQMQSIMSHYLEENIRVIRVGSSVVVSEIVYNCYKDFGNTKRECIINLAENYLPSERTKDILAMLKSDHSDDKVQQVKTANNFAIKIDQKLIEKIQSQQNQTI